MSPTGISLSDGDFGVLDLLLSGKQRVWIVISLESVDRYASFVRSTLVKDPCCTEKNCKSDKPCSHCECPKIAFHRKGFMFSPSVLRKNDIDYSTFVQSTGDVVYVPSGRPWGFINLDLCVSESVNYETFTNLVRNDRNNFCFCPKKVSGRVKLRFILEKFKAIPLGATEIRCKKGTCAKSQTPFTPETLAQHERDCHNCPVCENTYIYVHDRHRHVLTHNSVIQCTLCDRSFNDKRLLGRHMNRVHEGGAKIPCVNCKRSILERNMEAHMENCRPETCKKCKRLFATAHFLAQHIPFCKAAGMSWSREKKIKKK